MVVSLDIFAFEKGEPRWLGARETLRDALELARKHGEGSYIVFSQKTGDKNSYEIMADGTVALSQVSSD